MRIGFVRVCVDLHLGQLKWSLKRGALNERKSMGAEIFAVFYTVWHALQFSGWREKSHVHYTLHGVSTVQLCRETWWNMCKTPTQFRTFLSIYLNGIFVQLLLTKFHLRHKLLFLLYHFFLSVSLPNSPRSSINTNSDWTLTTNRYTGSI